MLKKLSSSEPRIKIISPRMASVNEESVVRVASVENPGPCTPSSTPIASENVEPVRVQPCGGAFSGGSALKILNKLWRDERLNQRNDQSGSSSGPSGGCKLQKVMTFEEILKVATSPPKGQQELQETPSCSSNAKAVEIQKLKAVVSKEQELRNETLISSCFTCSVCQDYFIDPVLLNCGHTFCQFCISEWRTNSYVTCPICRQSIRTVTQEIAMRSFIEKLFENSPDLKEARNKEQERRASIANRCSKIPEPNLPSLFRDIRDFDDESNEPFEFIGTPDSPDPYYDNFVINFDEEVEFDISDPGTGLVLNISRVEDAPRIQPVADAPGTQPVADAPRTQPVADLREQRRTLEPLRRSERIASRRRPHPSVRRSSGVPPARRTRRR